MNSAPSTKRKTAGLARKYQAALRRHLQRRSGTFPKTAQQLGDGALALGLETLDMARMHEQSLLLLLQSCPDGARENFLGRAGGFFAEVITPIEKTHRLARETNLRLQRLNSSLRERAAELATSNRQLSLEVVQRKEAEAALRKSERHYNLLLAQSREMQTQLRHLTHQLLSAQEDERKTISRELHDEIAQTLTGINVQLSELKATARLNTRDLEKKINTTQRLVEKSVDIVHRFARELRPAVLDDLGLIPALHSFAKDFAKRSRLRIHLRIFPGIEQLDSMKRTVLYRVAQEALTNVARHARATRVEVCLEELEGHVHMHIKDNGRSFSVERTLRARRNNRLGLVGMRERVEMVGGRFQIKSVPGSGTKVEVFIPVRPARGVKPSVRKLEKL